MTETYNDLLLLVMRAKIEMRPRLVLETRGGDFNNVTEKESTMLPSNSSTCLRASSPPKPSNLLPVIPEAGACLRQIRV